MPEDGQPEVVAEARRGLLIQFAEGLPGDPAERRAALLGLVREEAARLEQREADHERREAADRAELADRLAVDTTAEGERMRRYQLDFDRKLHRALDGLLKLRRAEDLGVAGDPAPDDEPGAGAGGDGRTRGRSGGRPGGRRRRRGPAEDGESVPGGGFAGREPGGRGRPPH